MGKTARDALKRAGIERTDQLLTEVLLNPEVARTLLMKATPANRPFIAQRLASRVGTLAAVAPPQGQQQQQPREAALTRSAPSRRLSTPALAPATVFGTLAPGGAISTAVR